MAATGSEVSIAFGFSKVNSDRKFGGYEMRNTKNENFKIYDYKEEYMEFTSGICHIVATDIENEALLSAMRDAGIDTEDLGKFIIIPLSCAEAFNDSYNNDEKYTKRGKRKENVQGYEDGDTEVHHKEIANDEDILAMLIDKEDVSSNILKKRALREAFSELTVVQERRLSLYFKDQKTLREIAEIEGCSTISVHESIKGAIKKLKKLCEV